MEKNKEISGAHVTSFSEPPQEKEWGGEGGEGLARSKLKVSQFEIWVDCLGKSLVKLGGIKFAHGTGHGKEDV